MSEETRHIVITGVTRGLGHALALQLVGKGHQVSGCGRSAEGIAQLASDPGPPEAFHVVDVTDPTAVANWAEQICKRAGPPDLLINNAAIINDAVPLWQISPDDFGRLIDVNLKGVHHVIHAFLPAMMNRGSGLIINLSSGWGRSTSAGVTPYCCSKWGIEGLTRALAQELPPGLGAIPLNPGIINTEMLRTVFGPNAESYCDAEAWATRAAPFLLGLSARDNGQPLSVPG